MYLTTDLFRERQRDGMRQTGTVPSIRNYAFDDRYNLQNRNVSNASVGTTRDGTCLWQAKTVLRY